MKDGYRTMARGRDGSELLPPPRGHLGHSPRLMSTPEQAHPALPVLSGTLDLLERTFLMRRAFWLAVFGLAMTFVPTARAEVEKAAPPKPLVVLIGPGEFADKQIKAHPSP